MTLNLNFNLSSASELSAILAILKAEGIALNGPTAVPAASRVSGKVIASPDGFNALCELYKAKTGKGRASVPVAEMQAVGWSGASGDAPQELKALAMSNALLALGVTQQEIDATGYGTPGEAMPGEGAAYEVQGEIPEPEAMALDDY